MAEGKIRFTQSPKGQWHVFGVSGAKEEKIAKLKTGWRVGKKDLPASCFLTTWMHHEGYQQLSQRIDLPVLRELIVKPGMLTGLSGQYVGPVNSAACKEQKCEDLTLGKPLRLCVTPNFHKSSLTHQTQQASYELLKKLPGEVCSGLLPKIKVSCSESYLLELKIPSDGSMGAETHIGIYGLMTDPKGEPRVWPLRFFPNKNHALNFLEAHRFRTTTQEKN